MLLSPKPKPSERRADDLIQVSSILDTLNSEAVPVAVYRMGKKDPDKPRIMKVVFATRHHQREVITTFISTAREQKEHFPHKGIFIRKSLTAAERDADRLLRDKLKKERDKGVNCWIFAGQIAYGPPRKAAPLGNRQ